MWFQDAVALVSMVVRMPLPKREDRRKCSVSFVNPQTLFGKTEFESPVGQTHKDVGLSARIKGQHSEDRPHQSCK